MATATDIAPTARLKTRYLEEIRPALVERFGYTSVMQAPKLEKITVNMGVGLAKQDSKVLKAATEQLAAIAGQQPSVRRARKSIAAFKLREGMPVGLAVTLRAERSYEFLDRLISVAIPRIRDFRGLNARSFDGRGNYSLGVKEQIIFPEIDYDAIDSVRGLDITITTSAATDIEAYALLAAFGMPFSADRRPKGYDPDADAAAERAHEEAEIERAAAAVTAEADAAKAAEAKAAAAEAKAAKAAAGKADKRAPKAADAEPEAAAEPEAPSEPEASAEPEAAAEPEAPSEPEASAEPEAEVVEDAEEAVAEEASAEAAIVAEAEAASEPEPEPAAEPEPEAAAEPEPEAAAEPEPEAAAEPDAAANSEESDVPSDGDAQTTEKESTD
jgi:large subunit ribosomal protein L5